MRVKITVNSKEERGVLILIPDDELEEEQLKQLLSVFEIQGYKLGKSGTHLIIVDALTSAQYNLEKMD